MPITGVDCTPAALLIDTQAPLDVLHETAAYRIRAVTQLLENIAFREEISSDAVASTILPCSWRFPCAMAATYWTSSADDCRRKPWHDRLVTVL
jgi:hypothetical protein